MKKINLVFIFILCFFACQEKKTKIVLSDQVILPKDTVSLLIEPFTGKETVAGMVLLSDGLIANNNGGLIINNSSDSIYNKRMDYGTLYECFNVFLKNEYKTNNYLISELQDIYSDKVEMIKFVYFLDNDTSKNYCTMFIASFDSIQKKSLPKLFYLINSRNKINDITDIIDFKQGEVLQTNNLKIINLTSKVIANWNKKRPPHKSTCSQGKCNLN